MKGIHKYDNDEPAFLSIAEEVKANPLDCLGYIKLASYYGASNLRKSYLCYENALFYCKDDGLKNQISSIMTQLTEMGYSVPKAAIVILNWNLCDMTLDCIESIRKTTPSSAREIIIVDNGSVDDSVERLRKQDDIILIENEKNEGFPKGCNIGIAAAEKDSDIYLLNNDTLLTANSLFWLRMGLYEDDCIGATGSCANNVPNFQEIYHNITDVSQLQALATRENIPTINPYIFKPFLIGFSLLLKRDALLQTGYLDEIFSPGNYEDTDIGFRMLKNGYLNLLCTNSFIIHFGSVSFKKNISEFNNVLKKNQEKFFKKWNISDCNLSYLYPSLNLLNFYHSNFDGKNIKGSFLNINCNPATMAYLDKKFQMLNLYAFNETMEELEFCSKTMELNMFFAAFNTIEEVLSLADFIFILAKSPSDKLKNAIIGLGYNIVSSQKTNDGKIYIMFQK